MVLIIRHWFCRGREGEKKGSKIIKKNGNFFLLNAIKLDILYLFFRVYVGKLQNFSNLRVSYTLFLILILKSCV